MAYHIAEEETLDRPSLAALQRRKLAAMLDEILPHNPFYRTKFVGWTAERAVSEFESLPITTRAELEADQATHRPYGTNLTYPPSEYCRLHQTSGSTGVPLRVLDRAKDWEWWKRCWGIIYRGAGVISEDRFAFAFSFGPFIGFWAAFESAVAMGNMSLPAGGMSTSARLAYILANNVTVVCCTPTYALRLAEIAAAEKLDLAGSKVRLLIVAGEPGGSMSATREAIEGAWGARVFDHTGMTETGPHGFECVQSPGGVHLIESEFIVEVVDPASGTALPDGQAGELVVTNLGRWGWPVIRYRTGDQVRVTRERCACGRWFARMEGGILGRIDDMLFIRGNNVFPAAVEDIVRGVGGVAEFRVYVAAKGAMTALTIEVEAEGSGDAAPVAARVERAIHDRLLFKPEVRVVAAGSLPRFEMKAKRVIRES
ncbi:MAG TPA: AMP-binding protein [Phycisphaerae bacterium]|nr:AMP-binding protein [Phycisphaerae bacterium]